MANGERMETVTDFISLGSKIIADGDCTHDIKRCFLLRTEAMRNLDTLVAQLVKSLPAMQETQVQFLGQEDPLEKEMATHASILAWRSPWTEEIAGYSL